MCLEVAMRFQSERSLKFSGKKMFALEGESHHHFLLYDLVQSEPHLDMLVARQSGKAKRFKSEPYLEMLVAEKYSR